MTAILFHLPWTNEEIEACCFCNAYLLWVFCDNKYAAVCSALFFFLSRKNFNIFFPITVFQRWLKIILALSLFFLQQKPVIAIILYWSRCEAFHCQWLLLPSLLGNSPLEGVANGDLKVCRNPTQGRQGHGGRLPAICLGPSSCGTHRLLPNMHFCSYLLVKISGPCCCWISVETPHHLGCYVGHNNDENCVMFNGKMLNFMIWSRVIFF